MKHRIMTTRKQRKERQMRHKRKCRGDKGGGACRYGIFTVDTKPALAVLGIDTLKHVGGIRGIMGKWKWVEL
jgi:hypothetical protein